MAESSTGSFNNGSSIATLASDHLFTILLLLPIDSILSFAMTCKKFRYLACSDNSGNPFAGEIGEILPLMSLNLPFMAMNSNIGCFHGLGFTNRSPGLTRFVVTNSLTQILIWFCPVLELFTLSILSPAAWFCSVAAVKEGAILTTHGQLTSATILRRY